MEKKRLGVCSYLLQWWRFTPGGAGTMLTRAQQHNTRVDSTGKGKAGTGGFYRL